MESKMPARKGNTFGKGNKGKKRTAEMKKAQSIRVATMLQDFRMPKSLTGPHLALAEFLINAGYELVLEMVWEYDKGAYSVDLYEPNYHLAFEADGDYWHNYKETKEPGYFDRRDAYLLKRYNLPTIRFTDMEIRSMTKSKLHSPMVKYQESDKCIYGHDYTPENTIISGKSLRRNCKICLDFGVRKGKNLGNQSAKGYKHTPEAIEEIRKASIGRIDSPETRQKKSDANKGNQYALGFKQTDEAKAAISLAQKGKPKSPEHREKLRLAKLGNKNRLSKKI